MQIDAGTGLPELPEGYFWRVKTGPLGIFPWVELRKKTRFGSKKIDGSWWSGNNFRSIEAEIVYLASRIFEQFEVAQERESKYHLIGDYPPKSIEI